MIKALLVAGFILASGPSEEMFSDLKKAPNPDVAAQIEADIWASWMESGSATVDLLMQRASEAEEFGDVDLARSLYDRAVQIKPDYAEAWHRRAILFMIDDNVSEALHDFNETLTHEPRHFGAWVGLGTVFEQIGAHDEALEAYREALALHPNLAPAKQAERRLAPAEDGRSL
ncbi:MAG: tetratricopeptide repeat protein [Pseudomonadota bacterium]